MKILFLHLSDIHIEKKEDLNNFHITKIADSLHAVEVFDHIVIVVSGDIAFSGTADQYETARHVIGKLITKLRERYPIKSKPNVLVVPGNHDVDLSKGDLGHAKIQELYEKQQMESKVSSECEKQQCFLNFARYNTCFSSDDPLYHRRILNIDGFNIEANLINTALFSTIDEEKGLHFLPQHVISRISEPTGSDFVITIMHHSFHWFIGDNKSQLEHILLNKSSILFLGHEHILGSQVIIPEKKAGAQILMGGELSNKGDWTKSAYFASVLETDSFQFSLYGFTWDNEELIYDHKLLKSNSITPKPSCEKKLVPSDEFTRLIFQDEKRVLTKDFSEYFVFPRLQREERAEHAIPLEIASEKRFLEEIHSKKKIIIVGYDNSGKTILLKHLFKTLSSSKVVLFCDIASICTGNSERIQKNIFENVYGDDPHDYTRFRQIPKQEKVLIIDDIHRVDPQYFDIFIKEVESKFEYIIYSTRKVMELDIHERLKKVIDEDGSYERYRIMPYYSDKRNELISNIVRIKFHEDNAEQSRITNLLTESINKQRSLVNLDPDFIIQYTEYFCKNIKEASQNGGDVFSKVFEANIVNSVMPNLPKRIKIDKLFIVLDKVAYYIHSNKAYPLRYDKLSEIINAYNDKYDQIDPDVKVADFIKIATQSKIIKPCDGNFLEYKFCNKSYLAYFTAREIKRRYHEENDTSDLNNILNYSCFGINADILLFLTYITDNLNMLRNILQMVQNLTSEWTELDLNKINIPYLSSIEAHDVNFPTQEQNKQEEEAAIEQEKLSNMNNCLDTVDIYDYKEDDIDKLINRLNRSVSLLGVISRCLPSFEHMMHKEDKEAFVKIIYRLPNQIFYLWASEIERNKNELLEYVKQLEENDYRREKHKIEDIVRLLQWDSMSFLLDLYYIAITNSTKENSEKHLNAYKYAESKSYSLQHLMVLEHRERISDFIQEVQRIINDSKNAMSKTMAVRITRHLLIHSKTIQRKDVQQLESKYFPQPRGKYFNNPVEHQKLLLQRAKIEKIK